MATQQSAIPKIIATVIMNVAVIASFISVFFFTYGASLEEKVMKDQINYICNDFAGNISAVSPTLATTLSNMLDTVKLPDLTEADKNAAAANAALKKRTYIIVGVILVVSIIIVVAMMFIFKLPVISMLISTVIASIAVAITYFLFSKYFIAGFQSADPNFVKLKILEALKPTGAPNELATGLVTDATGLVTGLTGASGLTRASGLTGGLTGLTGITELTGGATGGTGVAGGSTDGTGVAGGSTAGTGVAGGSTGATGATGLNSQI